MKRILLMVGLICCSPAWAQEQPSLTPLQQYLYNESGYAPPAPAAAPAPQYPYDTAYVPYTNNGVMVEEEIVEEAEEEEHLNEGVRGMTW